MLTNGAWEKRSKTKAICRWFVAWENITNEEIAGAVAGYGGGGAFIVERFYGQRIGANLSKLWIDYTDRISNEDIDFQGAGSNALDAAERGLDCIWEWNDHDLWSAADEVVLLAGAAAKLTAKKDMLYLDRDSAPFLRLICEKAALTAGPIR